MTSKTAPRTTPPMVGEVAIPPDEPLHEVQAANGPYGQRPLSLLNLGEDASRRQLLSELVGIRLALEGIAMAVTSLGIKVPPGTPELGVERAEVPTATKKRCICPWGVLLSDCPEHGEPTGGAS